ncbi:CLUMA_CG015280, isoform A [Clunio marinus]|uniref:CLUMA_CG015280, isoform A n=1 Tax=Clunio marinus TaxID=568069 RepID=A0A1J1IS22_9DIPT|nr:CLUMA_CG015280, isoform A [Clunio marinus]
MEKRCAVLFCNNVEPNLFVSPKDPDELKEWKENLNIHEAEFHVCSLHFDESFIETKKVLSENAVPTKIMNQNKNNERCSCCCQAVKNINFLFPINVQMKKNFQALFNFELFESNLICYECKNSIANFISFKNKIYEYRHEFLVNKNINLKKEEESDIAEVLIPQNIQLDPFAIDDHLKEETDNKHGLEISQNLFNNEPDRITGDEIFLDCGILIPSDDSTQSKPEVPKLFKHIRQHLPKSSRAIGSTCPICHKTMKNNSIYSHIRMVHNKERDQICQVCGKALKTSYDLKVHLRKHSGERPEICETCGKTFISYAQLYKHRKIRHLERENFQCLICLKNVLSRFKLKYHMKRFHPNGFDNGIRVNIETNFYHCKICSLKFVAMHKYEKHLKLNDCHKYEKFNDDDNVDCRNETKYDFRCNECGSILNTLKGLKKHIRFVHPKEPQTCTICSKQLKNPHTLWQHMALSHKQPVKKRKT